MGLGTPPQAQPRPYTGTKAVNFTGAASYVISVPPQYYPNISSGFTIRLVLHTDIILYVDLLIPPPSPLLPLPSSLSPPPSPLLPLPSSLSPPPSPLLPLPSSLSPPPSPLLPSPLFPCPSSPLPLFLLVAGLTPMLLPMEYSLPRPIAPLQQSSML